MKKYRYSEILSDFYRITIPAVDEMAVDLFFTGAAHHYHMAKMALSSSIQEFHLTYLHLHLAQMKEVIYFKGDFSNAIDQTLRGLEDRENWNPSIGTLPHPNMFSSMEIEKEYKAGQPHACDSYVRGHGLNRTPSLGGAQYPNTH